MSARPEIPADEAVNIEINGQPCQARKGAMIIEVTDELGITVPRFCYHKKLSVAANCRMCMVEVAKVPKPLPACATPVAEGMKVFTRSEIATGGQKAVMEFLLINHPLDCPICDQGGECELQDLALGYGRDVSRFAEKKRVVRDKYIGPLIATDMTRCIHCTRCIRMLREVAGKMELGATGRGENVEIGTYIEKSLESELSGNVIDVCPVGALTSKPFRFKARAWELQQHSTIAPHDCVGSNLFAHTRRGQVMRMVPRENEDINEVWLSDRDRFSYEGLYSEDRLEAPMVKVDGEWQLVDWETGLQAAVDAIRAVIDAQQDQSVRLIAAQKELDVAKVEYDAALFQSEAILLTADGEKDAIKAQNEAEALYHLRGFTPAFTDPPLVARLKELYKRLFQHCLVKSRFRIIVVFKNFPICQSPWTQRN